MPVLPSMPLQLDMSRGIQDQQTKSSWKHSSSPPFSSAMSRCHCAGWIPAFEQQFSVRRNKHSDNMSLKLLYKASTQKLRKRAFQYRPSRPRLCMCPHTTVMNINNKKKTFFPPFTSVLNYFRKPKLSLKLYKMEKKKKNSQFTALLGKANPQNKQ